MMAKNVGTIDKTLRLVIGFGLIVLALTEMIGWWGYIGVVPVVTALVNFCPLYRLLGIRTCKTPNP